MRENTSLYNLNVCSTNVFVVLLFLVLMGCNHNPNSVQIVDLRLPSKVSKGVHVVQKGDSVYSIAWRYDLDFKRLGAANAIQPPYTIYQGQRISLSEESIKGPQVLSVRTSTTAAEKKSMLKKHTGVPFVKIESNVDIPQWQWPVNGHVLETFSLKGRVSKGIDIHGKLGGSVTASASGEVVYAGNDLSGYGYLIILKHNNSYLSAYAHNRRLYAQVGDLVKANQKIAEIGFIGTTEPKLHFEIRRNGKPVDPLGYLPKR